MSQISVKQLFDETRDKLSLAWVAGLDGGDRKLAGEIVQKPTLALIGHLNFVHPNRVQVLGCAEMDFLRNLGSEGLGQAIGNLFSTELALIVVANNEPVPDVLIDAANHSQTPLLTSPQPSPYLMNVLNHYLTQVLAESISLHGVFLEVQGMGVLITGESGIGKSELALELITRGHRLIADDIVDFYMISLDAVEGRCPALLQDFMEVRGLGVLDIRTLFGETSVKLKKNLKLIVNLIKLSDLKISSQDRLQIEELSQNVLAVEIPKVRIPVASGRNIAVMVEVAVRNHILRKRGINSTREFVERHERLMEGSKEEK